MPERRKAARQQKRYSMHGGDIYRNHVKYDFSVNVNPLGMPDEMRNAVLEAMEHLDAYPDPEAEMLRNAIGKRLGVSPEEIIPGNGASEIFMAAVHALRPTEALLAAPSFSGYEYAVRSAGDCGIRYLMLDGKKDFALDEGCLEAIRAFGNAEVPLAFLACPNNPNGKLIEPAFLKEILETCEENGVYLILDECFLDFSERIEEYRRMLAGARCPHLIRTGAYTKICAIPGVRLGYAVVTDAALRAEIRKQLPEWNLSAFAQAAGSALYDEAEWMRRTRELIAAERAFLQSVLSEPAVAAKIGKYPTDANYMLLRSDLPLYDLLLEKGILIRCCADYPGLGEGYFRIAVKSHEENEILAETLREIC